MVDPISMAAFKARRDISVRMRPMDLTINLMVLQFKLVAMGLVTVARVYEAMADYTRSFTNHPQP